MKVLISGASGLVGTRLVAALEDEGHTVVRLVRRPHGPNTICWDPAAGTIDADALEGFDAVVHLAGENIAAGRWTVARKRRIRDSRVQGTALLATTLAGLKAAPRVLVCASAIGYYGDRGDALMDESSTSGDGFLAAVCRLWESAAAPAREVMRVVHLRIGVVLSGEGGALPRMLPPFRLGLGGWLGDGEQYMSWIALDDLVAVIRHAIGREGLEGPLNAVAPQPVPNRAFTKTLGTVLHRPTLLPVPVFALRLTFGEMADELLLASTRVSADRLLGSGFAFEHPELKGALCHVLGR